MISFKKQHWDKSPVLVLVLLLLCGRSEADQDSKNVLNLLQSLDRFVRSQFDDIERVHSTIYNHFNDLKTQVNLLTDNHNSLQENIVVLMGKTSSLEVEMTISDRNIVSQIQSDLRDQFQDYQNHLDNVWTTGHLPEIETLVENYTLEVTSTIKDMHGDQYCSKKGDYQHYHEGHCYYFSSNTSNWDESRQECQSQGGDLIKISDEKELQFLKEKMQEENYWIGLRNNSTESIFTWSLDGEVHNPNAAASWWTLGEPNNPNVEHCVHFWNDNLLNDSRCTNRFRFICELSF